ncbi:MAG TPA: IS4 family transposase [Streptosporangiaceae bacterium]|nr:IS4 family transposase [Streptosporangiaceae bacterium]
MGTGDSAAGKPGQVRLTDRIGIGVLTRLLPRDLVDEVIAEAGRREQRRRLLPARVVVYYVLALCLFFGEGYEEVMRRLVGGLQFMNSWSAEWTVPTTGAICQARQRLGAQPLRLLFERVAVPMARPGTPGAWVAGRRLMAIDGFVLEVADTPANEAEFGRSGSGKYTPFPQVRVVGLGECGTHAIVAAAFAGFRIPERELARELFAALEPGMLVLADRGFYSYRMWQQAQATGADLLWRVPATVTLRVVQALPDGSYLSFLPDPKVRQRRAVQIAKGGYVEEQTGIPVRVVEYEVDGQGDSGEIFCLVTTLTDPEEITAVELAAAYRQRWEFETALDELEIHQRGPARVLRSKSAEMVKQEIWALLLAHYAIRDLICQAASQADIDPDRLSFIRSLRVIRRQVTDQTAFSP